MEGRKKKIPSLLIAAIATFNFNSPFFHGRCLAFTDFSLFSPQVLLRQEHHSEDSRQAIRLQIRLRLAGSSGLQPRGDSSNGRPQTREERAGGLKKDLSSISYI